MVGLEKFSMQLWIYRKKSWRWFENSVLYIYNVDISRGFALYIYHCGDVSGEVPPVLIPNTEVKLTCAENT